MTSYGFKSLVLPLMITLALSVLGVLIAVLAGLAWE